MTPREIEQFFHAKIPLTAAMGVRVESYDAQRQLILTAPLDANHNHLGTAFGGSLAALLILSGYGLLWLELGDCEGHLVVRKTSTTTAARFTICSAPSASARHQTNSSPSRKPARVVGRRALSLHATVEQGDEVEVEFRGRFVALRDRTNNSQP